MELKSSHKAISRMTAGVLALLLGAITLGGCSSQPAPGDDGSPGEEITIGFMASLSPPGDVNTSQLMVRGAELAVRYVNEKGGVNGKDIRLAVQDDKGQPDTGVAAMRTLATQENAIGVTGFSASSVNIAVNEIASRLGVPTLTTFAGSDAITSNKLATAFRHHGINKTKVGAWLQLFKQENFKTIAVVAEDTDYGLGIVKELERQVKEGNLDYTIKPTVFDHTVSDLTPQLLSVKASKPDIVINAAVGQPIDLMINQASTIGLFPETPMLVTYDTPTQPNYWKLHGDNGVGLYFTVYYAPQQKLSAAGEWLIEAYKAEYGEDPVYATLTGFGGVVTLADAVRQGKASTPEELTKALANGSFESWTEQPVSFPEGQGVDWHNASPPIVVLEYTEADQNWREAKLVTEFRPTKTP